MKLIVGLGNPGDAYAYSRHNAGFLVVKALARDLKVSFKREMSAQAQTARAKIGRQQVILALPMGFMNLSGNSAARLIKKHKIDLDDLLVVCDDLDLELGRLRLRPAGSSGGHRGIQSVIDSLGDSGFARLRFGIGRPSGGLEASDYVLSPFSEEEKTKTRKAVEEARACCASWVIKGITKTMNAFNRGTRQAELRKEGRGE